MVKKAADAIEIIEKNASGDIIAIKSNGETVVIASEAFVTAKAISRLEGSLDWSVLYTHRDLDGVTHETSHFIADMYTSPIKVVRAFLSRGLILQPGTEKLFVFYLKTNLPQERFTTVLKSGWLEEQWVYVQPQWTAGEAHEPIQLMIEANCPTLSSMSRAGTLKEWKQNVAELLRGNPIPMFCIIFSFLGPLIKPLGIEGGGAHLVGASSSGKTTALQCASSTFGRGASPASDSRISYVQTWNQTSNGLEGLAAGHTDALTALDEVGLYPGSNLGGDLYLLAGGRGKGAMDSHRRLKNVRSWRGNILSSGELGILEAIEQKGGRAKAGMLVRLIDIPVTNMFPNPPEDMSAGEFSNLLKMNCATYFGTAGRAFVKFLTDHLAENPDAAISDLREQLDEFFRHMIPEGATPIQERAIRRFAAIKLAGHAAVEAKVLPYTYDEVDACIEEVMEAWMTYRPTVTDVQRSLGILQDFLVRNASSLPSFRDAYASNPKGFRDVTRKLFAFTDAQFMAATGNGSLVDVAKELRRQGFLFCNEIGRLKSKMKILGDTETRFYVLHRRFMEADLSKTDVDETVISSDSASTASAASL